ncbi:MAG: F0F1 ATP synthase subunit delta [Psychromonas sp.]|nr:F0F1 ATP synthase subunit delta [Psychromonas sp.]
MSNLTTVARPYARATFELAIESGSIAKWSEMLSFAALVAENVAMVNIIKSNITPQKLADVFINVCEELLNKEGINFIKLLAEYHRLSVLPRIFKLFTRFETAYKKEIDVSVVSAFDLTKKQKTDLGKSLEKRLAQKINFNYEIDKKVITGMVITAGDIVMDSTAKNQLSRLYHFLQS